MGMPQKQIIAAGLTLFFWKKNWTVFLLERADEPKESQVYVRDEYNRSTKKYEAYKFEDISDFREFKGDKKVYIDFYF